MNLQVLSKLEESVDSFCKIRIQKDGNINYSYNRIMSVVMKICTEIVQMEKRGFSREEILEKVKPARQIHSRSPFVKRLQEWPRGYPGDFETLEYLFNAVNKAEKNTVEYIIEAYALQSPPAQQHRNKTWYSTQLILDLLMNSPKNKIPKILLVSTGNSRCLSVILNCLENLPCELFLNDTDENALAFSRKNLSIINNKCHYIKGYFSIIIKDLIEQGPYDLVIINGLFDYLKDKHVRKTIRNVYNKLLNRNGQFYFSNIAKYNPYRPWIEYLADWILIERSREDIDTLIKESAISPHKINMKMDGTGLTYMVTINRNNQ